MQRGYNPYRWEYTVIAMDNEANRERSYRMYHHVWEIPKGLPLRFEYINNNRWSDDYWKF